MIIFFYRNNELKLKLHKIIKLGSFLLFTATVCSIFSCNSSKMDSNTEIIFVDVDKAIEGSRKNIGLQVEINSIIHLHHEDEALVGRIEKVKYLNGKYYVLDKYNAKTLFLFDSDGSFLKKINLGKGPGELNRIQDFIVEDEQIVIWDEVGKLMRYNFDLDFLSEKKMPGLFIRSFDRINDTLILAQTLEGIATIKDHVYNYYVYSNDFDTVIDKHFPLHFSFISFGGGYNVISSYNSRVLFNCNVDNNIYQITNDNITVPYKIDFGKYNLLTKEVEMGMDFIVNLDRKNQRIINIVNIFENKDFLSLGSYHIRGQCLTYFYSKESKKVYYENWFSGELPRFELKGIKSNGDFIGMVNPNDLKEFYKNNGNPKFRDIDPSDNPSLIIFNITEIK